MFTFIGRHHSGRVEVKRSDDATDLADLTDIEEYKEVHELYDYSDEDIAIHYLKSDLQESVYYYGTDYEQWQKDLESGNKLALALDREIKKYDSLILHFD